MAKAPLFSKITFFCVASFLSIVVAPIASKAQSIVGAWVSGYINEGKTEDGKVVTTNRTAIFNNDGTGTIKYFVYCSGKQTAKWTFPITWSYNDSVKRLTIVNGKVNMYSSVDKRGQTDARTSYKEYIYSMKFESSHSFEANGETHSTLVGEGNYVRYVKE